MKTLLCSLTVVVALANFARGEALVALTATNQLVRFDSAAPGTILGSAPITGLAPGDALAGIDMRPANGLLYGFATDSGPGGAGAGVGRVYSINFTTGVATLAATLAADPADNTAPFPYASISGDAFGVDFNPVADRLRIVSDTGQNLRINVATGLTQLDGPLAYAAGDANVGTPPAVVAAAYTNSVAGALTTLLYDLDSSISNLTTQNPPNNGALNSTALTSSIVFADSSFDISGSSGVGYVVLDGFSLGSMNLTTGQIADLGAIGTQGSITGLAVVPEPAAIVLVCASTAWLVVGSRRRR
jgi:hypothetical protein